MLLAIRTIAAHSSTTYGRMARLVRFLPDAAPPLFADIADQFDVIKTMADGQREFLHGVIDFYQTRTSTHMTIAAENLLRRESSRTRTCAGSPPGSRSSPYPPQSPASSVRMSPTRVSGRPAA